MSLDIDEYRMHSIDTILFSIPRPYRARISSSGKGVHIVKDCCCESKGCYDCWLYVQFDDKNRLRSNEVRKQAGLSHNVLWDKKHGRASREWVSIEDEHDIEMFLRRIKAYE